MSENNGHCPGEEQRPPVEFADWIYEDVEILRPDFPDDGVPECSPHGKMRALDRDNYKCYVLMRELHQQFLRNEIDTATYGQRHHDLHELSAAITKSHRVHTATPGVAYDVTAMFPGSSIAYIFGVRTRGIDVPRLKGHCPMRHIHRIMSSTSATLASRSRNRISGDPPVDHVPGALSTSESGNTAVTR